MFPTPNLPNAEVAAEEPFFIRCCQDELLLENGGHCDASTAAGFKMISSAIRAHQVESGHINLTRASFVWLIRKPNRGRPRRPLVRQRLGPDSRPKFPSGFLQHDKEASLQLVKNLTIIGGNISGHYFTSVCWQALSSKSRKYLLLKSPTGMPAVGPVDPVNPLTAKYLHGGHFPLGGLFMTHKTLQLLHPMSTF